jgi:hypothetical protein
VSNAVLRAFRMIMSNRGAAVVVPDWIPRIGAAPTADRAGRRTIMTTARTLARQPATARPKAIQQQPPKRDGYGFSAGGFRACPRLPLISVMRGASELVLVFCCRSRTGSGTVGRG